MQREGNVPRHCGIMPVSLFRAKLSTLRELAWHNVEEMPPVKLLLESKKVLNA